MQTIPELTPTTPAFVYDESRILCMAELLDHARAASGCKMLYSIKSLPFAPVLDLLKPWMDGFSVSSLFEAKLAAAVGGGPLHITTPGLRREEIGEIAQLCGFVAFNSLPQFHRLRSMLTASVSPGIRVNPKRSFLSDHRYDPCRRFSKLGADLDELAAVLATEPASLGALEGLHFHTVFSARSFEPMSQTLALIENRLSALLPRLRWINLGGGYLFESAADLAGLIGIATDFRKRFGLTVYFEPGKAMVGRAGYLVASVIDLFDSGGQTIAILDTTVNHHPEAFEYQLRPQPAWREPEQCHTAILAGCTCLAGDVFGEYRFEQPLRIGDRVAFADVGAYSLIKAHRFNGYNLPAIYAWDGCRTFRPMKRFGFDDYRAQWTADAWVAEDYHGDHEAKRSAN